MEPSPGLHAQMLHSSTRSSGTPHQPFAIGLGSSSLFYFKRTDDDVTETAKTKTAFSRAFFLTTSEYSESNMTSSSKFTRRNL